MKKIFIALSVLAVVAFVAVPAQALIGMPDAVPGSQTLVPFWIVDINFNGDDTLVTLTNVAGVPADPRFDPPGVLHLEMYNSRSVIVHNETIPYTKYDVVGIDFGQVVRDNLSLASLASCAVDLDNDGTADHYAGYAYVTDLNYNFDHWIAHLYQLDLAGGMAAGVVIPVKEVDTGPCVQYDDGLFPVDARGDGGYEAFNSDAYTSAESMIAGTGCADGLALRLMPRYYIHDAATGETQLIVWQSENLQVTPGFPIGGLIHINWFDEEEHKYSSDLDIPDELNIINIEYWLPGALKGDYPWAGWLDMPLIPAGAPGSPFIGASPWGPETQMMAYSWQLAVGAAQESWSVLFDVHRDAWGTLD
jgi:hypothetical protein